MTSKKDVPKFKVIKFWATWCGPCRPYAPIFSSVAHDLEGLAEFEAVDVDKDQQKAQEHLVMSVPTVVITKDGAPIGSLIGLRTDNELNSWVRKTIERS